MITIALAAATLAGCTSTPARAPSTAHPPTATTAPAATAGLTPTPAATPSPEASPHSTAAVRPSPPPQPPTRQLLLTRRGLGGVPVGATLEEFVEALGTSPTPMSAMDRSVFADMRCVIGNSLGPAASVSWSSVTTPKGRST